MIVTATQQNEKKFRELVLYISQKCATDPKFGATKLNKILYFSDFLAYANLGKAITGFDYQRLAQGPAPRRLLPVQNQMIDERELVVQEVPLWSGNVQKRTVNLRKPDLSVFSAEEISLVDDVIDALKELTAEAVSEFSHRWVGWKLVQEGESIPYNTIFLSDEPLTEAEVEQGRKLAEQFRLLA